MRRILLVLLMLCVLIGTVDAASYVVPSSYFNTSANASVQVRFNVTAGALSSSRDGNIGTYAGYSSQAATLKIPWALGYQFPTTKRIGAMTFYSLAAGDRVKEYYPQYSNDGTTWYDLTITGWWDNSVQNGTWAQASDADGWNTVNFTPTNGTYFRLISFSSWLPSSNNAGVMEVMMYEAMFPAYIPPTASFTSTNISPATNATPSMGWQGQTPFTMRFDNTSTGDVAHSWVWNATPASTGIPFTFNGSAYSNPIYTFNTAGNYSIKLNVTSTSGSAISTQTLWVNVTQGPITSDFTLSATSGTFPLAVTGTDITGGSPTNWNWSVYLTSSPTSFSNYTTQNLAHTFTYAGTFTVEFTAASDTQRYTTLKQYVVVTAPVTPAPTTPIATVGTAPPLIDVNNSAYSYSAHYVRFSFKDEADRPYQNINVTATIIGSTGPWEWLITLFGLTATNADIRNVTLQGITGYDGSWTALMQPTSLYWMHVYNNRTIDFSFSLYPEQTEYAYIIDSEDAPNRDMMDELSWNFTLNKQNSTHVELGIIFNDTYGETTDIQLWVMNSTDIIYTSSVLAGPNQTITYNVTDVPKEEYSWGFIAHNVQWGNITLGSGTTTAGPTGTQPLYGTITNETLTWIGAALIVMVASTFSSMRMNMHGAVLLPLFAGVLWFICWVVYGLPLQFTTVGYALVVGVMIYLMNREQRTSV